LFESQICTYDDTSYVLELSKLIEDMADYRFAGYLEKWLRQISGERLEPFSVSSCQDYRYQGLSLVR